MFNKIITHSGTFHNDEVLSCAILLHINPNAQVIRTRDAATIIKQGKYDDHCVVVDVGLQYDPEHLMFDHHQPDCKEVFQYIDGKSRLASAGMIWQHFGNQLAVDVDVWVEVYKSLIEEIDRQDNGEAPVGRGPVFQISGFNPSWESNSNGDKEFQNAIVIAGEFLANAISRSRSLVKAKMIHRETTTVNDVRGDGLFIMDQYYPWTRFLLNEGDHPYRFVVYPRQDGDWAIQSIPVSPTGFENKGSLPLEWVDGNIEGMIFCHKARFIASFITKERAIEMAHYAISQL